MASIKDVATRAGVSVASVSRVLNGSQPVAESTRTRVIRAVSELDYSIDQRARALRRQKSGTLGLIVAEVGNPFSLQVVHAIEAIAYRSGHDLFLCNSDEDESRERFHLQAMMAQRIGGIIILPVSFSGREMLPLVRHDIPIVCLDRRVEDAELDTVLVDNLAGGAIAADALFDAGHRRIGVIMATRSTPGRDRLTGIRERLAKRGTHLAREFVREVDYKEHDGYAAVLSLMSLPQRPTALFIGNHPQTIGALRALSDLGVKVPRDVSVLGFDDPSWGPLLAPALTTVSQPTDQLGTSAAQMLIERVEATYTGPARTLILPPHLISRASVARVT